MNTTAPNTKDDTKAKTTADFTKADMEIQRRLLAEQAQRFRVRNDWKRQSAESARSWDAEDFVNLTAPLALKRQEHNANQRKIRQWGRRVPADAARSAR